MLSAEVSGHGAESMARSNFELIGLGLGVEGDCPLDEDAALKVAEAEFLRARIKIDPLKRLGDGGFWLNVRCAGGSSGAYVYSVDMEWTWKQGAVWPARVLSGRYGEGIGVNLLQEKIGKVTEEALTGYLKENLE
jgi:hypothetical protein